MCGCVHMQLHASPERACNNIIKESKQTIHYTYFVQGVAKKKDTIRNVSTTWK